MIEREKFEFRVINGKDGFFMRGTQEGLVAGPRNPGDKSGNDDHLTAVVRGGDLKEIHRKVDGEKVWSYRPTELEETAKKFFRSNMFEIESSLLAHPTTLVVSGGRAKVAFSLIEDIGKAGAHLVRSRLVRIDRNGSGRVTTYTMKVNERELRRFGRFLEHAFSPFRGVFEFVTKYIGPQIQERVRSWFLIQPQKLQVSDGICLLVSEERMGILWVSSKKRLSFLPLAAILEAYERFDREFPLGPRVLGKAFRDGTTFKVEGTTLQPRQGIEQDI